MNKLALSLLTAALLFSQLNSSVACTDVRLKAKDGTLFISRSMEFGIDVGSNIRTSVRNRSFANTTPDGKSGLSWNARYGYIYFDGFGQNIALDGMNETGLTFEYLYLPGETQYQSVPAGAEKKALSYSLFGDWVLGNFKSVADVKQALNNIYVYPNMLPGLGDMILPAHASITDANGNGIIVEFVHGEKKVYDSIGIMTNSPQYDWQVTNLRNYINLSPFTPNPVKAANMIFSSSGQGAGSIGIPGDFSPPSRFVKASFLANTVYQGNTASDTLNLAQHVMNNFDIPAGASRTNDQGKISSDITQWVVFKDVTHKILYYRSYSDLNLKQINLSKLDFSEKAAPLKMPVANSGNTIIDATSQFVNTKS